MEREEILKELEEILKSNISDAEKREKLLQYHESDIADLTDEMEPEEREAVFHILGNEFAGDVLLHSDDISEVVENIEPEKLADIIETMDADDAIDVLEELDEEQREEVVSLMEPEAREDIKAITKYDDDMIGSMMTNNYVVIKNSDNVKSAMKEVIAQAAENDNVSNIFVLDENDKFYGVLELRELIIARANTSLESIIKKNYPYFLANAKIEDCLQDLKDYGLDSYPILDENDQLVGVITSDDVIEAIEEQTGEDYAKLAGLTEEEELDESVFASVKKRIPWLIVLLILGLAQSFSLTGFEQVVAALPIIVFFQTLVLDMAGNTGTQSLAVTIRMISTKEVSRREIIKTLFKEIRVGILNGLLLAILSFGFVFLYLRIANKGVDGNEFELISALQGAGIVGVALLIAMTVSSFIGTVIPIVFLKLKIDPAVASGPFITTINDVTALLIYYGLAAALLTTLTH